jgi:hypothetical protein
MTPIETPEPTLYAMTFGEPAPTAIEKDDARMKTPRPPSGEARCGRSRWSSVEVRANRVEDPDPVESVSGDEIVDDVVALGLAKQLDASSVWESRRARGIGPDSVVRDETLAAESQEHAGPHVAGDDVHRGRRQSSDSHAREYEEHSTPLIGQRQEAGSVGADVVTLNQRIRRAEAGNQTSR